MVPPFYPIFMHIIPQDGPAAQEKQPEAGPDGAFSNITLATAGFFWYNITITPRS